MTLPKPTYRISREYPQLVDGDLPLVVVFQEEADLFYEDDDHDEEQHAWNRHRRDHFRPERCAGVSEAER